MVEQELRPGDKVSIVGETDEGMIQALAVVLGPTSEDWYQGRLEDGSEVDFRIDQVDEVLGREGYELGGFLDWFKKKPKPSESTSLIPLDRSVIVVSPSGVAHYEERAPKRGMLAPIKEAVQDFFTRRQERGWIPDIFKNPASLIPPETDHDRKPSSIFAQFIPPENSLAPAIDRLRSIVPAPGPTPLAPYIERAAELVEHIQPSQEPIAYEEKQQAQEKFWEGFFDESKPEESLNKMFEQFIPDVQGDQLRAFPKDIVITEGTVEVPDTVFQYGEPSMAIKPLPMPPRKSPFPTVEEVARGLIGFMSQHDKKGRQIEEFPYEFFQDYRKLSQEARAQKPVPPFIREIIETIGLHDGHPDPFEGMSIFLQIPWEEFRKRAVIEDLGGGEEEWTDVGQINDEIMYPAMQLINDAMALIKPKDIPGYFSVDYSDECGCLQLYYTDQTRELTETEMEYISDYGSLPEEGIELFEEAEETPQVAPKKKPKKKKKKAGK